MTGRRNAATMAGPQSRPSWCDLDAIAAAYAAAPDEAVFLERALLLEEARRKYAHLPVGERQGRTVQDLCAGVTPVVLPCDVLLGRVKEVVPSQDEERFVSEHPELFLEAGLPGWLQSTSLYIPDWAKLLRLGLGGLIEETAQRERAARSPEDRDLLTGTRLSLEAVSLLATRYAGAAREAAARLADLGERAELERAAACCETIASAPPRTFREALQLFVLFQMVLSCVVGGRDVTPGRMDQYLLPYYQRDLSDGTITQEQAAELLAAMMLALPQLTGHIATDFQSTKRSPSRFSHYYITLGGLTPEGESAVNELSRVFLAARRLVRHREPTLVVRYHDGIDRGFWREAVALMRDGLPAFPYNDHAVIPALVRQGVPEEVTRDYAACACMLCYLPGRHPPVTDAHHNAGLMVLLAMTGGRDLVTGERTGASTPTPDRLGDFDAFFAAFQEQMRHSLSLARGRWARGAPGASPYPLLVRPLFDESEPVAYVEHRFIGLATAVDSLLAIKRLVYEEHAFTLDELATVLRANWAGHEAVRLRLLNHGPWYGCDAPEVLEVIRRVADAWVETVERAGDGLSGVVFRANFHSWLYNLQVGKATPATPDGRLAGEPVSLDLCPTRARGRAYTELLRCAAQVPRGRVCSGGTPLQLSPGLFAGERGVDLLAALIEGYFAEGGLQVHFVLADAETLRDAIAHPERHQDLLVRVTGFSEHFVRLLPEVQEEIVKRAG